MNSVGAVLGVYLEVSPDVLEGSLHTCCRPVPLSPHPTSPVWVGGLVKHIAVHEAIGETT